MTLSKRADTRAARTEEKLPPMSREIRMPSLPGREEGRVVRWLVSEGQRVAAGDIIAEIETAHATHEIEATGDGSIERILVAAGPDVVRQGTPLVLVAPTAPAMSEPASTRSSLHETHARQGTPRSTAPGGGAVPSLKAAPSTGQEARDADKASAAASKTRIMTYREALTGVIAEEMRRQPNLVVVGHDVRQTSGAADVMQGLAETFGEERVLPAPVVEDGLAGVAVGAALGGLKPLVVFSSWTAGRVAVAHILETLANLSRVSEGALSLPLVFRAPAGDRPDQAGAFLSLVPSLTVGVPATPAAAQGLMRQALRGETPFAILEPTGLYELSGHVSENSDAVVAPGQARIRLIGRDATLVTYGAHVHMALEAARLAAAKGQSVEVIDLMTLAPLDVDTVTSSLRKTGRLVTLEEAGSSCSIGQRLVSQVYAAALPHVLCAPVMMDDDILFAASNGGTRRPAEVIVAALSHLLGPG